MTIQDFFKYGPYRYCFKSLNTLGDILELIKSFEKRGNFFKSIRGNKLSFSHQNGKWNIHQVFRYFTDTERHLICRCPRFVGNGKTVIANLDNVISVEPFKFNQKNFKKLGKISGKVISNPILLLEVFINLLVLEFIPWIHSRKSVHRDKCYSVPLETDSTTPFNYWYYAKHHFFL